jgi:hypothetical protein
VACIHGNHTVGTRGQAEDRGEQRRLPGRIQGRSAYPSTAQMSVGCAHAGVNCPLAHFRARHRSLRVPLARELTGHGRPPPDDRTIRVRPGHQLTAGGRFSARPGSSRDPSVCWNLYHKAGHRAAPFRVAAQRATGRKAPWPFTIRRFPAVAGGGLEPPTHGL